MYHHLNIDDMNSSFLYHAFGVKDYHSYVSIKKVKRIGIDEFAVRKGHVYKTIVVDLDTGHIIYVGDGKGSDALDGFWKKVKRQGCCSRRTLISSMTSRKRDYTTYSQQTRTQNESFYPILFVGINIFCIFAKVMTVTVIANTI
jgi:hypothetical protein